MGDPDPADDGPETLGRRVRRWASHPVGLALLAMGVSMIAIYQANADGSWRPPFFFDEVWRVDFIRSGHPIERMYTHDTPIPLGWVLGMHAITGMAPYKPVIFRSISAGWFLLAVGVLTVVFVRIAQRSPRADSWSSAVAARLAPRRPSWMSAPIPVVAAPIGVALVCFIPRVSHFVQYFNNYTFEILYVALMVLAAEALDRSPRWAFGGLCALMALSPLFVLGGLFAVPALVVCAAWWSWRSEPPDRPRRLAMLAGACFVAALIGVIEWVKVYKPVSAKPSIAKFWIEEKAALGGDLGLWDLLSKTVHQAASGMIGDRLYFVGAVQGSTGVEPVFGPVQVLAYAVLAISMIVGMVAVWRRWPWLVGVIVSAWFLTVVASAVMHWPMTLERVNLCWQILFFVIAGFGLARSVLWFTPKHPSLGIPVLAVVFVALWFDPYPVGLDAFSRNLTYDLQVIGNSPAQRNLVFQYHPLAHFYADNELLNTSHGDRTFEIISEALGADGRGDSEWLFGPLDGVLSERQMHTGDIVWCVIPLELGEKTYQACQFSDLSRLDPLPEIDGRGAKIKAYRVR